MFNGEMRKNKFSCIHEAPWKCTQYVAYFVNDRDEEKRRKSIKVGMISL